MNSKPATDKEWIDAVTNGATVTAHPDTIAMIAKDDPQLAERIVPHERIEVGRLVAVRKYKPQPTGLVDGRLRVRADALERLVQAWKQATGLAKMTTYDYCQITFEFPTTKDAHEFRKCMVECESLFGKTAIHHWSLRQPDEDKAEHPFDPRHPETIPAGIYLVKWKDGKTSPAAVGENVDGKRWLASCTWYGDHPVSYHAWPSVESLELIVPNANDGLLGKTRVNNPQV